MGTQQFCLRWNNHQTNLLAVFDQLLQNEAFVDVTLACEGLSIKAHKMVLSACSPYFQSLFLDNPCQHPIVILKDVRFSELKAVVDFMYKGEVNVSQDQLSALLKTAETLKVKGLAEVTGSSPSGGDVTRSALGVGPASQGAGASSSADGRLSPPPKRKRGRPTKRPSTDGDLEVVESLVDVVPDGPDSVPTPQDRSVEANPSIKSDVLTETSQPVTDQSVNPSSEMTFDGLPQEHTSNSRDSGMMITEQAQTSSLGQLPATASTSGMSPGQGTRNWSSQQSYKMWTKEAMFTALKAVFARRMTYQQACDHFSIPVPTFYYYMSRVRKVLKPLEKEDYDPASETAYFSPDQVSIKGRHGKRLNIAENDLNAAILSVVCRSGKLIVPSDTDSATTTPTKSSNFSPTSPIADESLQLSCSAGDMEFMNRMNVKPRGRQRSWKQEDMYNAIKAILTHQMSLAKASRQFGIPYPTLKVYLKKVSSMSKPPEWADTETPPSGWTPPQNTWPYQSSTLTSVSEIEDPQKMEYDRKLDISEVYSESTSDSSQDDVDDDEDPVGPPDNSAPNLSKPVENDMSITSLEDPKLPCPNKTEETEQQPGEQPEEASENESMDEEAETREEEEEEETHETTNGREENNVKREAEEVQNNHENEDEEHDNRPPWIEVLTLD